MYSVRVCVMQYESEAQASSAHPARWGWGVVWSGGWHPRDVVNVSELLEGEVQRNQRAEMTGMLRAMD